MIPTHLIGGLLAIIPLLGIINYTFIFNASPELATAKDIITSLTSIAALIVAIPLGFLINQLWMTLHHYFFDVHGHIDFSYKAETLKKFIRMKKRSLFKKYWKANLKELTLALLHRHRHNNDTESFLSWNRNRLNDLHSNATSALSLLLGTLMSGYLYHFRPDLPFLIHQSGVSRLFPFYFLITIFLIVCILRASRSYHLIKLYNSIWTLLLQNLLTEEIALNTLTKAFREKC